MTAKSAAPSTSRNPLVATAKKVVLFVVLGLLVFYIYKHRADFAIVSSIHLANLMPVVVLIAIGQVIVSYIFHLLLTFISHPLSFVTTFKYFVVGRFMNKFVPFSGGVYRTVMFKKKANVSYLKSIATLVSFSWLNVLFSLMAGIIFIGIYDPFLRFQKIPILALFIFLLVAQALFVPILSSVLKKYFATASETATVSDSAILSGFRQIHKMGGDILFWIVAVMKNKALLFKSGLIMFFDICFNMIVLYFLFHSLGTVTTIPFLILLVVTMRLSTVVEITPNNLGIREFVYGFLAGGMGQTMAQGIIVSILYRLAGGLTQGVMSLILIAWDKNPSNEFPPASVADKIPKSIFLLAPSLPFRGGIAHYNTLLYNHLSGKGEVMFYTYKKQYFKWLFPGKSDKDNSVEKIETIDHGAVDQNQKIGIKRELHPLNFHTWIKAGIEARKYAMILLPWWVVFWAPHYVLFLRIVRQGNSGTKVIFICHNVMEHERAWTGWLKKKIAHLVLKRGDYFILHSSHQQRQLARLLKHNMKPSRVSPHPHYQIFNKNRYTREESRFILDIPPDRKVILFFGFIRKYKGLEFLLKAIPLVKTYAPDILLLIVGEVWGHKRHADYYTGLIEGLGIEQNVCFFNRYVPNEAVELYFKASDFAVLPYVDGSGSGILQIAYGMDRPVVATHVGAFEEVVLDGKTGLLVPPGDEHRLAQAIIKMYSSDCLKAMEREIGLYKKRFAWSEMVECIHNDFF